MSHEEAEKLQLPLRTTCEVRSFVVFDEDLSEKRQGFELDLSGGGRTGGAGSGAHFDIGKSASIKA